MRTKYGEISSTEIEHNGTNRTIVEWAEILGVDYATVRMRYTRGKRSYEELFSPTVKTKKMPNLIRKNLEQRVEKLEQRLDALKQVVLDIAERIDK